MYGASCFFVVFFRTWNQHIPNPSVSNHATGTPKPLDRWCRGTKYRGYKSHTTGYQNHWRDSKYTRISLVGVKNPLGYFARGYKILGGYQIHCDTGLEREFSSTRGSSHGASIFLGPQEEAFFGRLIEADLPVLPSPWASVASRWLLP